VPPSAAPVADLAAVALDALDDGVLIEAGGKVVLANRALRTMAGAALAVALAAALDWPPLRQARLHQAARLHDLGQAAIDPELLGRPGPLRTLERDHVGQHAALGASLTEGVLDAEQRRWIRHHHDRWDAGGERIPDGARVIAVADAWDAMTSGRPYRPARTVDEALAEVDRCAGSQLPPDAGRLLHAGARGGAPRARWAAAQPTPARGARAARTARSRRARGPRTPRRWPASRAPPDRGAPGADRGSRASPRR
jgi:hypothetical protein